MQDVYQFGTMAFFR